MKRWLPFLLIAFVAVAALGGGTLLYRKKLAEVAPVAVDPAHQKSGAAAPHTRGAEKAAVVLEEFGDFQCPPCAEFWKVLAKVEADYHEKLQVIFREYPLQMHQYADLAARAAEAAGKQKRFWEMYELLFRNQAIWSQGPEVEGIFNKYALSLGLDVERFKTDLKSEEVEHRIEADKERANSMGVRSTPTVFLNNTMIPFSSLTEPGLRSAIDNVLKGEPPVPPTPTPIPSPTLPTS